MENGSTAWLRKFIGMDPAESGQGLAVESTRREASPAQTVAAELVSAAKAMTPATQDAILQQFETCLRSAHSVEREGAASAAGTLGKNAAPLVPALCSILDRQDATVNELSNVAGAFYWMGDAKVMPALAGLGKLVGLLGYEEHSIRQSAALALIVLAPLTVLEEGENGVADRKVLARAITALQPDCDSHNVVTRGGAFRAGNTILLALENRETLEQKREVAQPNLATMPKPAARNPSSTLAA